jgi:glucarate dehydratase
MWSEMKPDGTPARAGELGVVRDRGNSGKVGEAHGHGRFTAGMRRTREKVRVPLATNMCVTGFADLPAAVARRPAGVILADHHWWGGLDALRQLGRVCEVFGLGLSQHSNTHLGISLAAMAHAASTIPHLGYASDTHYPWQQGWDIVNEPFEFHAEDGSLSAPRGPGLGVTLNEDALQRLAEIARAIPNDRRDDDAVMRRWFPEWAPREDAGVMRRLIS